MLPKRELVKGSMEIYLIEDIWAIQTGKHTFCHRKMESWTANI